MNNLNTIIVPGHMEQLDEFVDVNHAVATANVDPNNVKPEQTHQGVDAVYFAGSVLGLMALSVVFANRKGTPN